MINIAHAPDELSFCSFAVMRHRQATLLSSAQLAPSRIAQLARFFCYSRQVGRREDIASFGVRYPKISEIKLVTLFSYNDNDRTLLVLAQMNSSRRRLRQTTYHQDESVAVIMCIVIAISNGISRDPPNVNFRQGAAPHDIIHSNS